MQFEKLSDLQIQDQNTVRTISIYHGDLTRIPDNQNVDLLVTSAFPNGYTPTKTSLIGALDAIGISMSALADDKLHDLREQCQFWISKELRPTGYKHNIKQIACFESGFRGPPSALVGNLFRGLFPFLDIEKNSVVAMPVLAAGDQGYPAEKMFDSMIESAIYWMSRGLGISELKIVVLKRDQAEAYANKLSTCTVPELGSRIAKKNRFDIFLSYSSNDEEAARLAKRCLQDRSANLRIFDYKFSIDPGSAWQKEIDTAIGSARSVLAITSPSYFASAECQEELQQARLRHKREGGGVLHPLFWREDNESSELWLHTINGYDCREADQQKLAKCMTHFPLGQVG